MACASSPLPGLAVTALQGVSNALLSRSVLRLRRKLLSGHAAPAPQGRSLGVFLRENPRFVCCSPEWRSSFSRTTPRPRFSSTLWSTPGGDTETLGLSHRVPHRARGADDAVLLAHFPSEELRCRAAVFVYLLHAQDRRDRRGANIPLLFAAESLQALSYALYAPGDRGLRHAHRPLRRRCQGAKPWPSA